MTPRRAAFIREALATMSRLGTIKTWSKQQYWISKNRGLIQKSLRASREKNLTKNSAGGEGGRADSRTKIQSEGRENKREC